MSIRRVVTGLTADGKSVLVSDEIVEPITATLLGEAGAFYGVWGSDESVKLPHDGSPPSTVGWFPPPGGFRFGVVVFAPEAPPPPDLDMAEAVAELARKVPGLVEVLEPLEPVAA